MGFILKTIKTKIAMIAHGNLKRIGSMRIDYIYEILCKWLILNRKSVSTVSNGKEISLFRDYACIILKIKSKDKEIEFRVSQSVIAIYKKNLPITGKNLILGEYIKREEYKEYFDILHAIVEIALIRLCQFSL